MKQPTVGQLIEKLSKLPKNAPILLAHDEEINSYADEMEIVDMEGYGYTILPVNDITPLFD